MSGPQVDVSNLTGLSIDEDRVRTLALAVLEAEEVESSVTVAFVETGEAARLNAEYRAGEGPTDVLSFSYDSTLEEAEWCEPEEAGEGDYLGDVVIAPEVARRNALEEGMPLSRELATLIIHGLLHLAGYDHEKDEGEMLERQQVLLDRLWPDETGKLI